MSDLFAPCENSRNEKLRILGLNPDFGVVHVRLMPGTNVMLHIHLRAWRKYRRLTQEKVAGIIGSKSNTISGWETGKRRVDLDDLAQLASAYGVEPAQLLYAPPADIDIKNLRETEAIVKKMRPNRLRIWLESGHALAENDGGDPK